MVILGYDPGGAGAGGVAVVDFQSSPPTAQTSTCGSVDEAVEWFQAHDGPPPTAIGVDSLLSWSTGPSGWRSMDRHLRQTYPEVQNSVLSSNSAYGAMAVQGMALAIRVRELWPKIELNETHPKILYYALTGNRYPKFETEFATWLCRQFTPQIDVEMANDHEWDALISAWGTWNGMTGLWSKDLMSGVDNLILPAGSTTYFWPDA